MPRKKKPAKPRWRAIEDDSRPELFQVTSSTGETWKAHLVVDGGSKAQVQFPVVTFTLQRWRATRHREMRTFHLRGWFGEDRFIKSAEVVRLREMDETLCEAVGDKCIKGGERMIGSAIKSMGGDLSFLGWERILLPQRYAGWSAWDIPWRQPNAAKGWVNATVISPEGLPFRVGWSLIEHRWAGIRTKAMVRLREECPEGVLEWVARYLCEEYTPQLPQHDEEVA